MRTSSTTVTFTRPFLLSGIDGVQPASTYTVETDEELLQALSFPAYRRVATLMFLPSPPGSAASSAGLARVATIDPGELAAALTRDATVEQELAVAVAPDDLRAEPVVPQPVRGVGSTPSGPKARLRDLVASVRRLRVGGSNDPRFVARLRVRFRSGLEQPRFGAPHRLREMEMPRLDEGFGRRVKLAINDWLPFNGNETAWIVLMVGGAFLVSFLMGR